MALFGQIKSIKYYKLAAPTIVSTESINDEPETANLATNAEPSADRELFIYMSVLIIYLIASYIYV